MKCVIFKSKCIDIYFNGLKSWLVGVEVQSYAKWIYILLFCFGIVIDYSDLRRNK